MLGYCPQADQVGIALTSVTIGAGGTCPFYSYCGDIAVVQAYGNQRPATVPSAVAEIDAVVIGSGRRTERASRSTHRPQHVTSTRLVSSDAAAAADDEFRPLSILPNDGRTPARFALALDPPHILPGFRVKSAEKRLSLVVALNEETSIMHG